jgi:putative DNA primase/helicase
MGQAPACPLEVARYIRSLNGWAIPIPYGTKAPNDRAGWPDERWDGDDLERIFGNGHQTNIGFLNGHKVGDIGDVDLDTQYARMAAPLLLPPTGVKWGRQSARGSHYEYRVLEIPDIKPTINFTDPTPANKHDEHKGMICQLIFNLQALAPSSHHPNGEVIEFAPDGYGIIAEVKYADLRAALGRVAAVALLAAHWQAGRHDMTLPLAGMLQRGGMPYDQAEYLLTTLCNIAGDDEVSNRLEALRNTYDKAAIGQPVTGAPTLTRYLTDEQVHKLREWLGLTNHGRNYTLDDNGNADRFVDTYGDDYRYNLDMRLWLQWDTHRWRGDTEAQAQAQEHAREIAPAIFREAVAMGNAAPAFRATMAWAKSTGMQQHISKLLVLASSSPLVRVIQKHLDADPVLLAFPNGYLNLKTWEFTPPRKDALITRMCAAPYDPDAHSDLWEFVKHRFVPDPLVLLDLFTALGYGLSGRGKEHMFIAYGKTKRGKSTILGAVAAALGDYATTVGLESFTTGQRITGGAAREDLVATVGRRMVIASEATETQRLNAAQLKRMLGGTDKISLRANYGKQFETLPVFALWILTNHQPKLPADDDAIWERVHVFPFNEFIPKAERDETERDKVINPNITGSAIINDLLGGWRRFTQEQHGKLYLPTTEQATHAYQTSQDAIARYLASECTIGEDLWCTFEEFKTFFREWLRDTGIREEYTDTRLGSILTDKGYTTFRQKIGGKTWACRRGFTIQGFEDRHQKSTWDDTEWSNE